MLDTEDERWMRRCAELTEGIGDDLPIGAVVVLDTSMISERRNQTVQAQFHRHAELIALLEAEKLLTADELSQCTLYSSVEPCAMCSFAIRKLNVKRVVFGLRSPMMGGYSKWNILHDTGLCSAFSIKNGQIPEVVPDAGKDLIINSWEKWNKDKWKRLSARKLFI